MKTSIVAGSMRTACALLLICLLTSAAACQLNDTDSAPPAPELDDGTESAPSPAQIGPVSTAQRSPRSADAGTSTGADAGPAAGNESPQPGNPADAAVDAASPFSTPVLPVLPGLDAGVLPPGMISPPASGDAATFVGG